MITSPASNTGVRSPAPVRLPLAISALLLLAAYGVETLLATRAPYFSGDVGIERAVQGVPWGPVITLFSAFDRFEGLYQVGFGLLMVLFIFLIHRRATLLIVAGMCSAGLYYVTQATVHRPRPNDNLVHVARHTSDFSYPSGHVVFFLWVAVLVTVAMRNSALPRWIAHVVTAILSAAFLVATLGRMELGEHWPSDVLAGLLLSAGWTLGVLSVRWLTATSLGPAPERAEP